MDSQMFGLLRATIHPLLDLQKMVAKRIQDTKGIVGKLRGFWDSQEYLRASKLAQQRVQVWGLRCFASCCGLHGGDQTEGRPTCAGGNGRPHEPSACSDTY